MPVNAAHRATAPSLGSRIVSLDQFRGYTVVGMLVVNFLGGCEAVPHILKHDNRHCSYADTIMPQFFFAVGFAYRLTFLRRLSATGWSTAALAVLRRCAGLILLGFAIYHLDGKAETWSQLKALGFWGFLTSAFGRNLFQTLVHIAVSSLWVLPVIAAGPRVRIGFMIASAALHLGLSQAFYYDWVMHRPGIDGGPLGFLTWTIPLLVGSLVYDAIAAQRPDILRSFALWAMVLMALGYGLSCLGGSIAAPPFFPAWGDVGLWTMSQRAGSVSYQTFAAGFSLAVYGLFFAACDRRGREVGLFRSFGRNALAAYVLHDLVGDAIKPFLPRDAPGWYVASCLLVYLTINYVFIRDLEAKQTFIRL